MEEQRNERPSGVIPVVPTPFGEEGALDLTGLEGVVDRLAERGADWLLLLGSGGEVGYLGGEERARVVETAVRRAQGRVPVAAGVVQFGTAEAVEEARRLTGLGAGALLVALPQYFRTPFDSVVRHYEAVARAADVPIFYYHFPVVFGLRLTPRQMALLFERVPLAGIKESALSTPELREHVRRIGRPISAVSGLSLNLLDALLAGGAGAICPLATLMPTSARALIEAFRAGDVARARRCQEKLFEGLPMINGGGAPPAVARLGLRVGLRTGLRVPQSPGAAHAGVKEALKVRGILASARTRDPQPPIGAAQRAAIGRLAPELVEL